MSPLAVRKAAQSYPLPLGLTPPPPLAKSTEYWEGCEAGGHGAGWEVPFRVKRLQFIGKLGRILYLLYFVISFVLCVFVCVCVSSLL